MEIEATRGGTRSSKSHSIGSIGASHIHHQSTENYTATTSVLPNHNRNGRGQATHEGFNMIRYPRSSFDPFSRYSYWLLYVDWFHFLIERASYKIFMVIGAMYILITILFACFWWGVASEEGDPCHLEMNSFQDAYLMSAITISTIGYGAPTTYFGGCLSIPFVVSTESFVGMAFHAIIIGVIFAKSQRGSTRGQSVAYSKQCLVRIHDGQPYFIFRCVETRKLQLVEAHVRLYAICDETCPITGQKVGPF